MNDEPFLEGAVGCRRAWGCVVGWLIYFPVCQSLSWRVGWRRGPVVICAGCRPRAARRLSLALQPPTQLSASELRDGLAAPVNKARLNRQGWQLLNFLRATPLWVWTEHFPYYDRGGRGSRSGQ